jgi:hypothetical protein
MWAQLIPQLMMWSFSFIYEIHIFSFWALNIASNISILISTTSSTQWCTLIHHLRYFYLVKIKYSCKTVETSKLVELVRIKPYSYSS